MRSQATLTPAPITMGLRSPALLAVLALLAGAAPAGAQGADSLRLAGVPAPRADAEPIVPFGQDFWERLRAEARRFRDELGSRTFARRYEISPELARMIDEEARAAGIDPELAFRLVRVESRFQVRARSYAGALGLTQLMPGTARALDRSVRSEAHILEPRTNLRIGFGYLRKLISHYRGNVELALLAYNRGEGRVDRELRRGRNPANGYSQLVLGRGSNRYRGTGLSEP